MRLLKSLSLAMVMAFTIQTTFAANVGDPQEVNIKVYGMWISENPDCSNPTKVFEDTFPGYKDMTKSPTFGNGNASNGTYNCVAIQMSDLITFKPDYTSDLGNCVQGVEAAINVFRSGETSTCPDGSVHSGSDAEETPCIYISTTGTADPTSPFDPSTPFLLSNPWVVSSDTTGTFVSDFTGKVTDNGGSSGCDAQAPTWGFR